MSIFSSSGIVVPIDMGGSTKEITFYPTRLKELLSLRKLSKELAEGILAVMEKSPSEYAGQTIERSFGPNGEEATKTIVAEVAQGRVDAHRESTSVGIKKLLDSILEPNNLEAIASLLCDSMRDEEINPSDLIQKSDVQVVSQMVQGLISANQAIFAPLTAALSPPDAAQGE